MPEAVKGLSPHFHSYFQAGSTGQLSTATAFANFAGCIARIFTSLQEGGGAAMVRGYVLGRISGRIDSTTNLAYILDISDEFIFKSQKSYL